MLFPKLLDMVLPTLGDSSSLPPAAGGDTGMSFARRSEIG
jgi:hypothetical protein